VIFKPNGKCGKRMVLLDLRMEEIWLPGILASSWKD
jgi:hypothetical protein